MKANYIKKIPEYIKRVSYIKHPALGRIGAVCALALAGFASASPAMAASSQVVVDYVSCGEVDPVVVGEACVAAVRDAAGQDWVLVADAGRLAGHDDGELAGLSGQAISVDAEALQPLTDSDALNVMALPGDERSFFWWDGSFEKAE